MSDKTRKAIAARIERLAASRKPVVKAKPAPKKETSEGNS